MLTMIIPGLGNNISCVNKMYMILNSFRCNAVIFSYEYNNNRNVFRNFDDMKDLFNKFILDKWDGKKKLNIIGFDEGGILPLYAFGCSHRMLDVRINKYVSLANPHRGAFTKRYRYADTESILHDLTTAGKFMTERYKDALDHCFKKVINRKNFIQFWSAQDTVAREWSSKKLIEEYGVTDCEVVNVKNDKTNTDHYQIKNANKRFSNEISDFIEKNKIDTARYYKMIEDDITAYYQKIIGETADMNQRQVIVRLKDDLIHNSLPSCINVILKIREFFAG
jgi:hypothetical protein